MSPERLPNARSDGNLIIECQPKGRSASGRVAGQRMADFNLKNNALIMVLIKLMVFS